MEVDIIFTPVEYRRKGYPPLAVCALVETCHNDDLSLHVVRYLISFYLSFGFEIIAESDLPATIRERYVRAAGNREGTEVQPVHRKAGFQTALFFSATDVLSLGYPLQSLSPSPRVLWVWPAGISAGIIVRYFFIMSE